jgi:hypothetical protein
MRTENLPTTHNGETAGFTFFFQIANKGRRQACSIRVEAPNMREATAMFRQNWSLIETMARDGINTKSCGDGVMALTMPADLCTTAG